MDVARGPTVLPHRRLSSLLRKPNRAAAKTEYNEILANVDYLHGIAESFLTITNLLIVAAFRKAVVGKEKPAGTHVQR